MYKYPYTDDPEPKKRPEDGEDRFIRKAGKIFDIVIAVAAGALFILFICGVVTRYF